VEPEVPALLALQLQVQAQDMHDPVLDRFQVASGAGVVPQWPLHTPRFGQAPRFVPNPNGLTALPCPVHWYYIPCCHCLPRLDQGVGSGVRLAPGGLEFDERRMALGNKTQVGAPLEVLGGVQAIGRAVASFAWLGRLMSVYRCVATGTHARWIGHQPCWSSPRPPALQLRASALLRFPRQLPLDPEDPDAFKLQVHRLSLKTLW
jgi:hypothetical protein